MKMFGNLNTEGLEEAGDYIGGGLLDTGVYTGKVKLAYAGKSQSTEAQSITVHVDINGVEFRETLWVTNRNGENFYTDKKDNTKKRPLPGFSTADDLCLVATGFSLADQDIENKTVKLYDFDSKKDVPQEVPVLVDVLGKEVTVAIIRQIVDKQKKNDSGIYTNTGETREENIVDKFFHTPTRRTVTEITQNVADPIFIDKWETKNAGKTRDRSKGANGNAGSPGAPGAGSGGAQKPKQSLFG